MIDYVGSPEKRITMLKLTNVDLKKEQSYTLNTIMKFRSRLYDEVYDLDEKHPLVVLWSDIDSFVNSKMEERILNDQIS